MTSADRQARYRAGKAYTKRKGSKAFRKAQAARSKAWRATEAGQAWMASYLAGLREKRRLAREEKRLALEAWRAR